jgi:cathepsin L
MKLLLIALVGVTAAKPKWQELPGYTFEQYVVDFGFNYTAEEQPVRKWVFEKRLEGILAHNRDSSSTFKENVNKFTALTDVEMNKFKGYNRAQARAMKTLWSTATPVNSTGYPASLDWRTKGAVTKIKNQESCGSCWAFASTETIESHVQIATGKLLDLSPQQITACTPNPDQCGGTGGCSGATAELAFDYISKNGGLATAADYPYTAGGGNTGSCLKKPLAATVTGFTKNKENDLDGLMAAVQLGPVSISVDASWGAYSEGIFDGCSKNAIIDHAVQLVGYGEDNGNKYWIVRNSWGEDWGEGGYIRLKRFDSSDAHCGTDNEPGNGSGCKGGPPSVKVCGMCGILYDTCYPTGAKLVNGEEMA